MIAPVLLAVLFCGGNWDLIGDPCPCDWDLIGEVEIIKPVPIPIASIPDPPLLKVVEVRKKPDPEPAYLEPEPTAIQFPSCSECSSCENGNCMIKQRFWRRKR